MAWSLGINVIMNAVSLLITLRPNRNLQTCSIALRRAATIVARRLSNMADAYEGRRSSSKKFWRRVRIEGPYDCWQWMGSTLPHGYGRVMYRQVNWLAHRLAYFLTFGEIPKGMLVCHNCDNTGYCNPSHLFLGTNKDNTADMLKKGRGRHSRKPSL